MPRGITDREIAIFETQHAQYRAECAKIVSLMLGDNSVVLRGVMADLDELDRDGNPSMKIISKLARCALGELGIEDERNSREIN